MPFDIPRMFLHGFVKWRQIQYPWPNNNKQKMTSIKSPLANSRCRAKHKENNKQKSHKVSSRQPAERQRTGAIHWLRQMELASQLNPKIQPRLLSRDSRHTQLFAIFGQIVNFTGSTRGIGRWFVSLAVDCVGSGRNNNDGGEAAV